MPSARESSPELGPWSSAPSGKRTRGILSGSSQAIRAPAAFVSAVSTQSTQVWGRRARRAPLDELARPRRVPRAIDLDPGALALLKELAPAVERREQDLGERAVLVHELPQVLALDRDVAHRGDRDPGQERGLAGHQAQLAEEARGVVADDLVAVGVLDRGLALEDRDERVALVADLEQDLAGLGRALLAARGEHLELRVGENRVDARHRSPA